MADALISTPVALVADAVAVTLIAVACSKVRKINRTDIVPLMGVLGAFVFAAQMLNFSIPGTGSSGHIIGGVFLAAFVGPWAAFLTIASVLVVQCLVFADGGLLALGCNMINMGVCSTLLAYPFIFKPLMQGNPTSSWRVMAASIVACVLGLEAGALLVTGETCISGITELSPSRFLELMCSIHLAIGAVEGLATGAILVFVQRTQPDLLSYTGLAKPDTKPTRGAYLWIGFFALATLVIAGFLYIFASGDPDGLEWSIAGLTGSPDLAPSVTDAVSRAAASAQEATAVMPDYNSTLSGIVGAVMVLTLLWAACVVVRSRRKAHVVSNK